MRWNLCPSCRDGDAAKAGSSTSCMDCGRLLRAKSAKPEAPPERHFAADTTADGARFHGRASKGMLAFPIGVLLMLGVFECVVAKGLRLSPGLVALFVALPVLAIVWGVLTHLHFSEVVITGAGIRVRSFPFGFTRTYARELVQELGWVRSPGPKTSYGYDVFVVLRDGRRIRVPLAVESEAESTYVAKKLRTAFDGAA